MAFDKDTRNRLAKFVADARGVIADEFTEQFQSLYGISAQGDLTPLDKLGHLDEAGLATAALLRERIDYLEKTHPDDMDGTQAAVARLAREQAFTILNRLAALRMAEKRGLIVEAVGQGYQSKGFKVFETVAGSALGDTYHRYCRFLFCLFDELALDLGVLFDRRSPQALLFPREPALLALLDLLHAADLEPLWAEDETIGWIYQYYNDPEERKKMRAESAAPRNSRELAVRNQFFTPRYVVEFLTDNTLGRIWYEMTKGKTRLAEQCRYLVRRPTELFLQEGELPPSESENPKPEIENPKSQEELLKQPVHIPHRPLKDPRELRLLDPACGSMHFGLYAFDLFESIYEEAWDLEEVGTAVPSRPAGLASLHETYESKEAFLRDVPRLVIEHNIHGIDIDPRAVQIAGLSLWLRAQKAWQARGVKPADRPRVRRSNIVCAEPMPGSPELLEDFIATLNPPLLGELVKTVFEKMQLAGEAGSLLKIEEEIRTAIDTARQEWLKQQGDLFSRKDGSQEAFFDTAEQQVIDALRSYAEQADADSYQRRLFADDAARGFAFIDLCRKRYDAVVMNPPFGSPVGTLSDYSEIYSSSGRDIYGMFVERTNGLRIEAGMIGAIMPRTGLFIGTMEDLRRHYYCGKSVLGLLIDLGKGVLDDATIRTAGYVLGSPRSSVTCARIGNIEARENRVQEIVDALNSGSSDRDLFVRSQRFFGDFPGSAIAYWIPARLARSLPNHPPLNDIVDIRQGIATGDNFRFLRMYCELPKDRRRYQSYSKGGEPVPFVSDETLYVMSDTNACEMKANAAQQYGSASRTIKNEDTFGRAGITYSQVNDACLKFRVHPANSIYDMKGPVLFSKGKVSATALLAFLNSSAVEDFMRMMTDGRQWHVSALKRIPFPEIDESGLRRLGEITDSACTSARRRFHSDETSHFFRISKENASEPEDDNIEEITAEIDAAVWKAYGASEPELVSFGRQRLLFLERSIEGRTDDDFSSSLPLTIALGCAFGRWDIRYATGERQPPELPDPFAPLPVCPPGMLQNAEGLPAEPKDVPAAYPLRISWQGILVGDENHPEDIVARVREAIEVIWKDRAEAIEQEACEIIGVKTLRDYFRRPAAFFADHLKRYSKSRRQAPIYWPLSTKSGSYTLWLYYHRLSDQTLHTCLADFLDPKLRQVQSELDALTASGTGGTRAGELREFLDELHDLRDELARVIKLPWKPNLNDGVLITASPLWPLFRLPKWQKDLKTCWEELSKGDYDWAHLAYTIWPQRVEKACETDRSIAIAHNREDLCKVEPPKPAKTRKRKKADDEEEGDDAESPPDEMDFR